MRALLCLSVTLLLLWSAVQCDHHGHHSDSAAESLHQANQDFGFRLYKHISALPDSQSKNVFFSPLIVSVALSALSLGARGKTHQQLFEGLGFNGTDITTEEVHQAFQHNHEQLSKKTGVDLSLGNALFIGENFKPRPEFLENMKRYYHSEGFSTDFSKPEEAKQQINTYVDEKTKGKITKLVDEVDPLTVMYLINYIYFKGKWEVPFKPEATREQPFFVDNTTTVQVQMMIEKNQFDAYYDEELSTHVLHMHYNDSVSMLLLLPEEGLQKLEEVICMAHVARWLKWMRKAEYEVHVPKFSIKTSYSLKGVLTGMGMPDIFSDTADFTGITEEGVKLKVSKVVHQASLDVDEAGATAVAATGVGITLYSFRIPRVLQFNRPFMLVMCCRATKTMLFMGKIVNPLEK